LERDFQLCKHIPGFNLTGLRETSIRILDWYFGRLLKDIQDEQTEMEEMRNNG